MKHTKKMMLVPVQEGGSLDQQSQLHVTDGNTAIQQTGTGIFLPVVIPLIAEAISHLITK